MEVRKCVALGEKICSCFNRKRKAMDSLQIDKKLHMTREDLTTDMKEIRKTNEAGNVYGCSLCMGTAQRLLKYECL